MSVHANVFRYSRLELRQASCSAVAFRKRRAVELRVRRQLLHSPSPRQSRYDFDTAASLQPSSSGVLQMSHVWGQKFRMASPTVLNPPPRDVATLALSESPLSHSALRLLHVHG